MNTPAETAAQFLAVGRGKVLLPVGRMACLAVMAGLFIGLAGVGASTASASVPPAAARLVSACVFPAGLVMVTLTGSELFTGNCLLAIPWLSRAVTARQVLRNWIVVYLGNFAGAALAAAAAVYSHQLTSFSGALAASAMGTAVAKCSLSFSDAFLRGVACNILVCVAVWLALSSRSAPGKIMGIYLPIMLFVAAGFEHSVANMYYIPVALLAKELSVYADALKGVDVSCLTWGRFLEGNLLPVTLGNMVGGLTVGMVQWYCFLHGKADSGERE